MSEPRTNSDTDRISSGNLDASVIGWRDGGGFVPIPAAPASGLREALDALIWEAIGENEGCAHHYANLTYSCSCAVPVEALQDAIAAAYEEET